MDSSFSVLLRLDDVGTTMPFHVMKEESTPSLQRTRRQSLRSFLLAAELDIVRPPMPNRDYGSFSRACDRQFAGLVAHIGFTARGGAAFARNHGPWSDGAFLQQSVHGDGQFSLTIGFHVPELSHLWQSEDQFGLLLGQRVSEHGVGYDRWLPASNTLQLHEGLMHFASYLEASLQWFERVHSLSDLADEYFRVNEALHTAPERVPSLAQLPAANYGFLLSLASREAEAHTWLAVACRLMHQPICSARGGRLVERHEKGARLLKPSQDDLSRRNAVNTVLAHLKTGAV